jgi:hypothetical protein
LPVLLPLDFGRLDGGAVEVEDVGRFARIERCNVLKFKPNAVMISSMVWTG